MSGIPETEGARELGPVMMEGESYVGLLLVCEVDEADKVMCQSPGCGHGVYKRVHICRTTLGVRVMGSSCFEKHLGVKEAGEATPSYGSKDGRRLTPEEREAMRANTEELVRKFAENELAAELAAVERGEEERLRILALQERMKNLSGARAWEGVIPAQPSKPTRVRLEIWLSALDSREQARFGSIRRDIEGAMRKKFGIDATAPGWSGWVSCLSRAYFEGDSKPLNGMGLEGPWKAEAVQDKGPAPGFLF